MAMAVHEKGGKYSKAKTVISAGRVVWVRRGGPVASKKRMSR